MPLSEKAADAVLAQVHLGNLRKPETHVGHLHYCGRRNVAHGLMKASALHNMHNVGTCRSATCTERVHVTGADTLRFFEADFAWLVLTQKRDVMNELRNIWRIAARGDDVTLLCWCVPAPCHIVIVKRFLRELATGIVQQPVDSVLAMAEPLAAGAVGAQ